jgi:hypothetical protein
VLDTSHWDNRSARLNRGFAFLAYTAEKEKLTECPCNVLGYSVPRTKKLLSGTSKIVNVDDCTMLETSRSILNSREIARVDEVRTPPF